MQNITSKTPEELNDDEFRTAWFHLELHTGDTATGNLEAAREIARNNEANIELQNTAGQVLGLVFSSGDYSRVWTIAGDRAEYEAWDRLIGAMDAEACDADRDVWARISARILMRGGPARAEQVLIDMANAVARAVAPRLVRALLDSDDPERALQSSFRAGEACDLLGSVDPDAAERLRDAVAEANEPVTYPARKIVTIGHVLEVTYPARKIVSVGGAFDSMIGDIVVVGKEMDRDQAIRIGVELNSALDSAGFECSIDLREVEHESFEPLSDDAYERALVHARAHGLRVEPHVIETVRPRPSFV